MSTYIIVSHEIHPLKVYAEGIVHGYQVTVHGLFNEMYSMAHTSSILTSNQV